MVNNINQVYSLHHFNVYTLWYHQSTQSSLQSVNLQKKHCSVLFNAWSRNQVDYVAQEELDRLCPSDLGPPGCKQVHQVKSHRIMCKLQTSKPNMLNAGPDSNLQITSTTSTPNQHCQWPVPVSHSTPVQYSITVQYSTVKYSMVCSWLMTHDSLVSWLMNSMDLVWSPCQQAKAHEPWLQQSLWWAWAAAAAIGKCKWGTESGSGMRLRLRDCWFQPKSSCRSDSRIMFDWIGDWADSRSPRLWLYSALCAPFKFQIKAMLQQDYSATSTRLQRQHCNTYTLHPLPLTWKRQAANRENCLPLPIRPLLLPEQHHKSIQAISRPRHRRSRGSRFSWTGLDRPESDSNDSSRATLVVRSDMINIS